MTLKTTKEQIELLLYQAETCGSSYMRLMVDEVLDLCHDAALARELEIEFGQCRGALNAARSGLPIGPIVGAQTIINQQRELADLRAELGVAHDMARKSESDNEVLCEKNFAMNKAITDLRAKLNDAYEGAAQVCEQTDIDGEGPDCWDWHSKDYAAAIRALKEQEK